MFVVFLNLGSSFLQDRERRRTLFFLENQNKDLLRYVRSICSYKKEKAVSIYKVIAKIRKHYGITSLAAEAKVLLLIKQEVLLFGFDDSVSINVLANGTRLKIYNLIQQYPGLYALKIQTFLELGVNQTSWHLSFLLEFHYIQEFPLKKTKIYGSFLCQYSTALVGYALLKPNLRSIISFLMEKTKSITQHDLESHLQKSSGHLTYSLTKLTQLRILQKSSRGLQVYRISPRKVDTISTLLKKYHQLFD